MAVQIEKGRVRAIILIALLAVGGWFAYNQGWIGGGGSDTEITENGDNSGTDQLVERVASDGTKTIRIGVVTWPGYAPAYLYNKGFAPTENSRFFQDYGFKVQFTLLEDQIASRSALIGDEIDLVWSTVESFAAEANGLAQSGVEFIWQSDFSRGGDAIVVRQDKGVRNVQDLRGKTIAYSEKTPSHAFLLYVLESGGLTLDDIIAVSQPSAIEAAQVFNAGQVDAAVVWAPDNINCVETINAKTGNPQAAKVLTDTKTATHIIADGFLVKKSFKERNRVELENLFEGWMKATAEMQNSDEARREAAQILVDNLEGFQTFEDAYASLSDVYYTTLSDNYNFMGLNRAYNNVTAQELYTETGERFVKAGVIASFPNWGQVSDKSIVQSVYQRMQAQVNSPGYLAENTKVEKAPSPELANTDLVIPISSKALTVFFETGSSELDYNAKSYIASEFETVARTNMGATIRIVGNTDNTGSATTNKRLSLSRANAVRDYMVEAWSIDPNRIVVVGNGPKRAITDGVNGPNQAYRTVDFELIQK